MKHLLMHLFTSECPTSAGKWYQVDVHESGRVDFYPFRAYDTGDRIFAGNLETGVSRPDRHEAGVFIRYLRALGYRFCEWVE